MAGEFDARDGYITQDIWMRELLNVSQSFWNQSRQIYYFKSPEDRTLKVGGYFAQEGNFTLLAVPKSGHFMPADYYDASKAFMDDYVNHGKLICHSEEGCSTIEKRQAYMNNCSNHGSFDPTFGNCICDSSYVGADCRHHML